MPQQVYSISTLGGNWSVPRLAEKLRSVSQPLFRFRQFIDPKEAQGLGQGDTFNFDKAGNVATQGGTLVETNTIPETQYVTNQGTAVVTEYGNSVPFTAKLKALGQFSIDSVTEMKLRDDQVKVLESAVGNELVKTDFIAVNSATNSVVFTTNGTATATATADLTGANTRSIVDFLMKKLTPFYDGSNYVCIASVSAMSGMHSDTGGGGWVDISKYTETYAKNIFAGEVGNYYMTRFVRETGYLSNSIGSGSVRGAAVFLGNDSCYEAVSIPEEIRFKNSTDYGRDLGIAWYALLGFKLVWSFSVDTEQHVLYVTSA